MTQFIEILAGWQALLLSATAFSILGVVRRVGTRRVKGAEKVRLTGWAESKWFKMFLPAYPYAITIAIVFIPGVPVPKALGGAIAAKLLFAIWAGWLSDKSYQIIKRILEKGFGLKFGADKCSDG